MQGSWLASLASPSLGGRRTVACYRYRRRSWHIFLHSLRHARRLFLRRFKAIFFHPICIHIHMHMPIAKANQHHMAMQTVSPVLLLQHIHPAPGALPANFLAGRTGAAGPPQSAEADVDATCRVRIGGSSSTGTPWLRRGLGARAARASLLVRSISSSASPHHVQGCMDGPPVCAGPWCGGGWQVCCMSWHI